MRLHEAGRLGFCQTEAIDWGQAILRKYVRPVAQEVGIQKAHPVAYLPSHLFDSAAERRDTVQGDAGAVAAFPLAINLGYQHADNLAAKHLRKRRCWRWCSLPKRTPRHSERQHDQRHEVIFERWGEETIIRTRKRVQNGRQNVSFCTPDGFTEISASAW
jgi:hypothetical protein